MRPCLIKQPAGIGDVFFCQKIARVMMEKGYDVIWPLRPDIHWIQRYIKDIWFPLVKLIQVTDPKNKDKSQILKYI